jgi:hypothetical protein
MMAVWGIAFALLARNRREQLALGAAMLTAASLNVLVYPYKLPCFDVTWQLCSLGLFATSIAVTSWVVSGHLGSTGHEDHPSRPLAGGDPADPTNR